MFGKSFKAFILNTQKIFSISNKILKNIVIEYILFRQRRNTFNYHSSLLWREMDALTKRPA